MSAPLLIVPNLVALNLEPLDRDSAIRALVDLLATAGRITDAAKFNADVLAREAQMPTGMPGGVGLPHAKSSYVMTPSLAVGRVPLGVDFGAPDGPATLIFLIAAPAGGGSDHLKILAALARRLVHNSFLAEIRAATDAQQIVDVIDREVVIS